MGRRSNDAQVKIVKKIPSTENGPGVHCTTSSGQICIISQCLEKGRFTLWRKVEDGFAQIAIAKSPLDLDDKIPWKD